MVANPRSLSAQANFTTPPVPTPDKEVPVDVHFKLLEDPNSFAFNPHQLGDDSALVTRYNFGLNPSSAAGWSLSGIAIGPVEKGFWFTCPITMYHKEEGVAEFWVTVQPKLISVTIKKNDNLTSQQTISLVLVVYNSNANPCWHHSPDPQVVLVPR